MADLLLITPPFTQLNTPYPATAYIKGFLNTKDISSFQMDLGIEVILKLFTKTILSKIFDKAKNENSILSENCKRIYALRAEYLKTIEDIILFLQGKNQTLARLIVASNFLPQASRFDQLEDMEWAFGNMGMQDKAKHLATLYLEDLSDFIVECVDQNFGFSRYAERLGMSANSFDELYNALQLESSIIDEITLEILDLQIQRSHPKLVCFSVPFPGNLYSSLKCAQHIKKKYPDIKIAMGGGFANTELRSVSDPRVFEFYDFICLDDGELPLELLVSNILQPSTSNPDYNFLKRTFVLENGEVLFNNFSLRKDYQQADVGTPNYSDLLLDQYISVIEIANPMHSLWSDGRWNKLTMAHGCYWGKCTFCDVSLSYIKDYEPIAGKLLVDRMEQIITQTGETGFHFVDEAAPPALMRELAVEIIRRGLVVSWWTNIRFEKSFTYDLCRLLKASGCIAVSGGLEVASDRLLKLIDKGVTVEQVAKVTRNFTETGIMVHSYLMYGYPSQTVQETIDSLEMVRQLFEIGVLQSGFWHQFALTAHSPVGLDPESFGIIPEYKKIRFANNDIQFEDRTGIDHGQFSFGLKKSLFNYMHGVCFEFPLQDWFDFQIPKTTINPNFIAQCIDEENVAITKPSARLFWIGTLPIISKHTKKIKKKEVKMLQMTFHDSVDSGTALFAIESGEWLVSWLREMEQNRSLIKFAELKKSYKEEIGEFDVFWYAPQMDMLRSYGLLVL